MTSKLLCIGYALTKNIGKLCQTSRSMSMNLAIPKINISNQFLTHKEEDILKHFGLYCTKELCKYFKDVKFVCMGGSVERMKNYAEQYHKENSVGLSENLSKTDRFVMYKTGPILWVNHGMGIPSLSICLQECIKLMYYAETTDVTFMRLGTSGGLGVEPGTVVISTGAINEFLKPEYIQAVLGKKIKHDAILDKALSDELYECRRFVNTPVEKGITMGTDCFFEGQARLDGPFCDYSAEDATAFLRKLYELGVRNVEMECNCFAAITYRAGIRSAIICVTVVDRLHDDTLKTQKPIFVSPKAFREYEMKTFKLASAYFKDRLANIANNK